MAALLALIGYWGALGVVHRLAAADASSIAEQVVAPRGEHLIRAAAMPTAGSALRWQAVAETDQAMYRFVVQLGNTNGPQAADGSMTRYAKPKGPAEALAKNNEAFLTLARERFAALSAEAAGTLDQRKAQIETMLAPMQELLNLYQNRLTDIEKSRAVLMKNPWLAAKFARKSSPRNKISSTQKAR